MATLNYEIYVKQILSSVLRLLLYAPYVAVVRAFFS